MWQNLGIGLFFVGVTGLITFGIIGFSIFMERLYKKEKERKKG